MHPQDPVVVCRSSVDTLNYKIQEFIQINAEIVGSHLLGRVTPMLFKSWELVLLEVIHLVFVFFWKMFSITLTLCLV